MIENTTKNQETKMSNTATACFCVGKAPNCTCDGKCRCACTCNKLEPASFTDWMTTIDNSDLISEGGQQEIHKTKAGKGAVAQAIARDKLRKLPPNCS